jgi:uncharacterized protein YidB (DUF937 family)
LSLIKAYLDSIQGAVAEFEKAGLGEKVKSWVSTAPISRSPPRRSRRPLGSEKVKALAAQVGIPADKVADMLTKHLPVAIDKATPAGNLPQQSAYSWLQSNW